MELLAAAALARSLMDEHQLFSWSFVWSGAKRICGQCRHVQRQIVLSRPITLLNDESQVRDTILHEIAHALTPGQHHNRIWRQKAREIGARPVRCGGQETKVPEARYHLHCPACDRVAARRHRRPTPGWRHRACGTTLQIIDTRQVRSA